MYLKEFVYYIMSISSSILLSCETLVSVLNTVLRIRLNNSNVRDKLRIISVYPTIIQGFHYNIENKPCI